MGDEGFSQQRSVHKDLKPAVKRAIDAGWTASKHKTRGWTLTSPGKTAHFYIPITMKDGTTAAKNLDKLIADTQSAERWGPGLPPGQVAAVVKELGKRGGTINHGPDPTITCKTCGAEFPEWEGFAVHIDEEHPVAVIVPPVVEEVAIPRPRPGFHAPVEAIAEARENTASAKMHDMEEAMQKTLRPWRAIEERRRDGSVWTYASSAVLEVVVDGVVTGYKCPVCPYENPVAKGVVSHHSQHVAKGEAPSVVKTDYKVEPGKDYPQTIVKGKWVTMKNDMEAAIYEAVHGRHQGKGENDSIYARALVERLIKAGFVVRRADEEAASPEEVELLNQIRALLGVGEVEAAALAGTQAALTEALEALAAKEAERLEAVSKRDQLQGFVNTLAGFAKEEVTK